jgi:hypothetical protein
MKRKISISPSLLNSFWLVYTEQYNLTEERLEQDIRGVFAASPAMNLGTAVHHCIETGSMEATVDNIDYNLESNLVSEISNVLKKHGGYEKIQNEICMKLNFTDVHGFDVVMNMRIDAASYPDILEFKTSGKPKAFKDYESSMQWKCYLVACPEASKVTYEVFVIDSETDGQTYTVSLKQQQTFTMHRYKEVFTDVKNTLEMFVFWLSHRPELLAILEAKVNKVY